MYSITFNYWLCQQVWHSFTYLIYVTRANFRHRHNKCLRRLLKHQEQVPSCNGGYQAGPEPGQFCCLGLQLSHERAGRAQRSADGGGGIAGAILQNSRQGVLCTCGPGWDLASQTFPSQGRNFMSQTLCLLKKHNSFSPVLLGGHIELALLTQFQARCSTPQKFCSPNTGS